MHALPEVRARHEGCLGSARGSITIAREVVAELVAETASRCYGVVGLTPGSRVGRLLRRDGISVGGDASGLRIGLRVEDVRVSA